MRIVASPEGALKVGRFEPGRGAWLCVGAPACFDRAAKRGAFNRALRVTDSNDDIEGLRVRIYGAERVGNGDPKMD